MSFFTCFKANDIGGRLGIERNEGFAYRIGCAYAQFLDARRLSYQRGHLPGLEHLTFALRTATRQPEQDRSQGRTRKENAIYGANQNPLVDFVDGLSLDFSGWQMNLRAPNTEPLLRSNT